MKVGSQERERYEGNTFLDDRPAEEPVQKVASDHQSSASVDASTK